MMRMWRTLPLNKSSRGVECVQETEYEHLRIAENREAHFDLFIVTLR